MTPEEKAQMEMMQHDMQSKQDAVESKEDELYSQASPKGQFSGPVLNALVVAANKLLPLFGVTDPYPVQGKETVTSFPADFVRILSMFAAAIADAIEAGILSEDNAIDLTTVTDDNGVQALAGRLNMAAKAPAFKKMLMKKPTKPEVSEPAVAESAEADADSMSPDDSMKLFSSRM